MYAPIARIIIRYPVGAVIGANAASILAGDPDIVAVAAMAIAGITELFYALAVKKGWTR
jgi:hypothetical protein